MLRCGWWGWCLPVVLVAAARPAGATGVPIGGFLPLVGIGLTDEFDDDLNFFPVPTDSPVGGTLLGAGGSPNYDLALLDTGAAITLLSAQSFSDFGLDAPSPGEPDGYEGTVSLPIGGATGTFDAGINDALGLYAGGLQGRSSDAPFAMNSSALRGQTNTSTMVLPAVSDLPNVLGLSYASQYATRIRNDQPLIFQTGGQTVRTPSIEFLELGSGGHGITRRAPMSLNPGAAFQQAPAYFPNIEDFDLDNPQENPSIPTIIQGGLFLSVNAANNGNLISNSSFFFDTGADVTVVSELNAVRLGFDRILDTPDFTVAVIGSGGTKLDVPGFFADSFTIQAIGGSVTLNNVPIVVLDVADPSNPANIVEGIVGTNLLSGRNLVIDPNPSLGGGGNSPSLYISDPVTTQANWVSTSGTSWNVAGSWSTGAVPNALTIANVRRSTLPITPVAVISANVTVWEVNVSGAAVSQQMTLSVGNNATLTTFAGVNIEEHGTVSLGGGSIDAQYVDIRSGGRLAGDGNIYTGSGPIPGQVENVAGVVSPNGATAFASAGELSIEGRFSNGAAGTVELHLSGSTAGLYDRIVVDGAVTLAGTLRVVWAGSGAPGLLTQYEVITSTEGIGGEFDAMELPTLAGDNRWIVDYSESEVTLIVTLRGDFDGDFDFDADDLAEWQAGYGVKYDGADLLHWQRRVGTTIMLATAVPEPAAAHIALALAASLWLAGAARGGRPRPTAKTSGA
jgi:hypothetical protein